MAKKLEVMFAALIPAAQPTNVPTSIMEQARNLVNKQNGEKILQVTVEYCGQLDTAKNNKINEVRRLRKALETSLKELSKIDRAVKYAEATGNLVPAVSLTMGYRGLADLCRKLDCELPESGDKILSVPKEWNPEAETPAS